MQNLDDLFEIIERHPTKVSGAWVFRGTRVPVAALERKSQGWSLHRPISRMVSGSNARTRVKMREDAIAIYVSKKLFLENP